MNPRNAVMSTSTTMRATKSIILELLKLKTYNSRGKLVIQNKSVTFLYFILLITLTSRSGLNLLIIIKTMNMRKSEAKIINSTPWLLNSDESPLYYMNFEELKA